jgi:hypothetical protein
MSFSELVCLRLADCNHGFLAGQQGDGQEYYYSGHGSGAHQGVDYDEYVWHMPMYRFILSHSFGQ